MKGYVCKRPKVSLDKAWHGAVTPVSTGLTSRALEIESLNFIPRGMTAISIVRGGGRQLGKYCRYVECANPRVPHQGCQCD